MGKTEKALLLVAAAAAAYWLYQRSKMNAVAPRDQDYAANDPNGQVKTKNVEDYFDAAGTVWEGGKKVGGVLEDGYNTVKGWFS